ncbi:glycosyl transferase family protein [Photobacterium atrarenae]|uniref:Glycosyl transferase family protein n=1 Tax=Photobacterium atrarenae TaxID=865757 RepID=A0ABY5GBT2_9GAMM|nr:glycosyl transferase family protein [Photobacterium atrarenae]UTV26640.1 glycosyl transferase family protein [Photobacterium atrarenae]
MSGFDFFVTYLYGLKSVLIVLMITLMICGLDDLLIDLCYWIRRAWRSNTVYKKYTRKQAVELYRKVEQPLAIMVPAWQEHGVIDKMAELAASKLDYENYQIFVGTYPNDPQTQQDVDSVCARYPHVHKVVCARPGPTSKADCLNNIIASIVEFEKKAKLEFVGFILHDAEDILSPMELRLFNYLLPGKDLIQLPVYPYTRKWYEMTPGHYADEFAELHGKDVVVREAIAGQVPSAGVGTCFSRQAILRLLVEGDGLPFDVQSLTEDYDIGFRLKQWGMNEIFVRFPVEDREQTTLRENARGVSMREGSVVCVREHFPDTYHTAVRQKSRWIIGIVFQGFKTHKWTKDWRVNYFLWRDRRGLVNNTAGFLAMLLLLQLLSLLIYSYLSDDSYRFMAIITDDLLTRTLLYINTLLLLNRLLQRFYFVSQYYGYREGGLSLLRILWGNIINFSANLRALYQVLQQGDPRRVAWDKTEHYFPSVDTESRKVPLGQILVEHGHLSQARLDRAVLDCPPYQRLGTYLVCTRQVTNHALSMAIAEQYHAGYQACDPFTLDESLIALLPKKLALKYAALPIALDNNTVILGKEAALSPVALAAIERRIKRPVQWVITTNGAVTLGLRYWYLAAKDTNPTPALTAALNKGEISPDQQRVILDSYYASQCQLGACLLSARQIEPAVLHQALLVFESVEDQSLGAFLVSRGYVSEAGVQQALQVQAEQQLTISQLIARHREERQ